MIVKNMHGGRDATPNYLIVHSMTYDILLARNSHLALSASPELPLMNTHAKPLDS